MGCSSLVGAPNYRNMKSMLYDIQDYMTRVKYEDGMYYGNTFALAVNSRLEEMTNKEYHSRAGILLQRIRAFYHQPGKVRATECIRLAKDFSTESLEPYIFEEYFDRYLH